MNVITVYFTHIQIEWDSEENPDLPMILYECVILGLGDDLAVCNCIVEGHKVQMWLVKSPLGQRKCC